MRSLLLLFILSTSCATVPCDWDALYEKFAHCENSVCPPDHPDEGPGAVTSPHASVQRSEIGEGSSHTVIYEPTSPRPAEAPVVLFLHGYFAARPHPYELMLRHMARKGFIVIYPSYGHPLFPRDWAKHATASLNSALQLLENPGHVKPDRERVAFVGHSIGAILALHLAQANAAADKPFMPQPRLIVTMDAAGITSLAYPEMPIHDHKLSRLPSSTWLLLIMAEKSYQYRWEDPEHCEGPKIPPGKYCNAFTVNRLAYRETTSIPDSQKDAVLIPSDQEGDVKLSSEHNSVQSACGMLRKPVNAVDTWGYWKLTVGALDHVLRGGPDDYAFADTPARRSLGTWSTGRKARSILPIDHCLKEGTCPR